MGTRWGSAARTIKQYGMQKVFAAGHVGRYVFSRNARVRVPQSSREAPNKAKNKYHLPMQNAWIVCGGKGESMGG